jgi:hypothetical protein
MKQKTCAICRIKFVPTRPMQKVCSPACAYEYSRKETAKAETRKALEDRKVIRMKLEDLKPLSYFANKAQKAVNALVRYRDRNDPCISCGRFHDGAYDAGHYRSRGAAPALRFNLENIHKQCVVCNQHKSGNAIEYRIRLIQKIGLDRVEWLEQDHPVPKRKREDYERIEADAKMLLKEMQRENNG